MRRLLFVCTTLLVGLIFGVTVTAAQGTRYANPPITQIQFTGYEPLPPGIPVDVFYGGVGGGGGGIEVIPRGIYWESTPDAMATGEMIYFSACGYSNSSAPPIAILTAPSGVQTQIALDTYEDYTTCYDTFISLTYGMEIGIYTMTFSHSQGTLTHTFGYDYPLCWQELSTPDGIKWLTGLDSNEQLSLVFYSIDQSSGNTQFVGIRNIRADEYGVVAMQIQVSRSAPFTVNDIFYVVTGVGRKLYDMTPAVSADSFLDQGYSRPFTPDPQPTNPNTSLVSFFVGADVRGRSCDGEFSRFAQVYVFPNGTGSMPVYANINSASITMSLSSGTVLEITDTQPANTNGRIAAWKHIRTEDGRTGWTPSGDMIGLEVEVQVGMRAEVRPIGVPDPGADIPYPAPSPLFDTPEGSIIGQIQPKTEVTLLGFQEGNDTNWWHVRFANGTEGWMYDYSPDNNTGGFEGLAWSSVSTGSTGGGSNPNADRLCRNSPPPRLTVGSVGRVTPGDPNRLRVEPESGRVLTEIRAGESFSVLAGPSCGPSNGLTWWQVNYNGVIGWTAEGQGNDYWLEPVG